MVAIAAFVSLSLLVSGCDDGFFGMDDHLEQMHGGAGGAPQTPVMSDASQVNVEVADFDFSPRELTIRAGSMIMWTNFDSAPHDATDEAGGWGTSTLRQGESAAVTFDVPGEYDYLCTIHPDMKGKLTVEAAL